jgi:hypothetical protein
MRPRGLSKSAADKRNVLERGFWNSLVYECNAQKFSNLLRLLVYIRDGVKYAQPRESALICGVINVDVIKEQAERGMFGWHQRVALVCSVVEVIRRAQEPGRADHLDSKWNVIQSDMAASVNAMRQLRAFSNALEFVMECVTKMRADAVNSRIRRMSQAVICGGLIFEREKFEMSVRNGTVSLRLTEVKTVAALAIAFYCLFVVA